MTVKGKFPVARRRTRLVGLLALLVSSVGCKRAAPTPPLAPPQPIARDQRVARVAVAVNERGFDPARIPAQVGVPITLVITRTTDATCATDIVFKGDDGKIASKTALPLNRPVEVTYTPQKQGDVRFGCAMGMMVGGVLTVGG